MVHTGEKKKKKTTEENDSFLQRYDTVLSFLGIEIIALVFFGFAGLTGISVLRIFGALIAVMAFPFVQKAYSKQQQYRNQHQAFHIHHISYVYQKICDA